MIISETTLQYLPFIILLTGGYIWLAYKSYKRKQFDIAFPLIGIAVLYFCLKFFDLKNFYPAYLWFAFNFFEILTFSQSSKARYEATQGLLAIQEKILTKPNKDGNNS